MEAELILGLAELWHCPPSQVRREGASVLRLLAIRQAGTPESEPDWG